MDHHIRKITSNRISEDSHTLLCFSHLRWNFVYQRPQHVLSIASKTQKILYFEEPAFEEVPEAFLRANDVTPSICVLTPILPIGTNSDDAVSSQRKLLDRLLASVPQGRLTLWYYTPMALRFSDHLLADVCVYDCMDELSAFKNAPAELVQMERRLFQRADVVFTGGLSLYEAKRAMHASIYPFPSSIDFTHFHQARGRARILSTNRAYPTRVSAFLESSTNGSTSTWWCGRHVACLT
ncbi:hypothetical protein [Mesorhizobium sp. M8A.F.Ca.ET.057.01.1.1]|uniref:hypothetical protein n=1 Tax=Mesorhizobium sp. M8A.F.Ca.ET.057.01.1.1 TaxID=2493679 RepID=UPI001FE1BDE2|nr:hypothetical protein [Mesorhizobium sp. M8A.F.Ca.ET.057.01.1.1]